MQAFQELMPIGYSKEPKLEKFIILILEKQMANDYLRKYKSKYPKYFEDQNHLKLMRTVDDKIQMLFCRSNDFDNMKLDFNIDQYIEVELPINPPIHKEQMDIYNSYWNINHPIYLFPSKQFPKAGQLLQYLDQQDQKQNRCLLYDPSLDQIIAEAYDESNRCVIRHSTMVVMEKLAQHINQQNIEFVKLQYIATDLILVIQTEPCIMCSMALGTFQHKLFILFLKFIPEFIKYITRRNVTKMGD